jgi:hypothetical protein
MSEGRTTPRNKLSAFVEWAMANSRDLNPSAKGITAKHTRRTSGVGNYVAQRSGQGRYTRPLFSKARRTVRRHMKRASQRRNRCG